jgi:hypothetical protein
MPEILILTAADDIHGYAVAEAVRRKGGTAIVWITSDYPQRATETIHYTASRQSLRLRGVNDALENPSPDTVWHRRPMFVLDRARLHPADRDFAEESCRDMRESVLATLAPGAFWVNPQIGRAQAKSKAVQHAFAVRAGLRMPDTLYSNDPDEIRSFIREHGGRIVMKPLRAIPWQSDDNYFMPYTALLTEEKLVSDDLLRVAPAIYQELVEKAYEVRVTVIGRRMFAAQIHSQQSQFGQIDWRKSYGDLKMSAMVLPEAVEAACLALLDGLGLVFGCIDFIVTAGGDYIFLEINQMGQFLFVEHYTGLPLLDAFSEFLVQGSVDYDWDAGRVGIRYEDVKDVDRGTAEDHVPIPNMTHYEGTGTDAPDVSVGV